MVGVVRSLKTAFNRTVKFSTKFQFLFVGVFAVLSATITYASQCVAMAEALICYLCGCSSAASDRCPSSRTPLCLK